MNKKAILEGSLFVVGEDGLTIEQIEELLAVEVEEAYETLISLKQDYEDRSRGLMISLLGDRYKLTTKKEHREFYQRLVEDVTTHTLSAAALETLAIVAYNQPITRIVIDEIRGVSSAQMVRKLVAKGLLKEAGRSNLPGRPILYQTTSDFLDYFGLESIKDLPPHDEFVTQNEVVDDIDLYHSTYAENNE